jgi:hypothetical protein
MKVTLFENPRNRVREYKAQSTQNTYEALFKLLNIWQEVGGHTKTELFRGKENK